MMLWWKHVSDDILCGIAYTTKASAAMVLTIQDKQVLVFHE